MRSCPARGRLSSLSWDQPSGTGQGDCDLKLDSEIHAAVRKYPPRGILLSTIEGLLWKLALVLLTAPNLISGELLFKSCHQ